MDKQEIINMIEKMPDTIKAEDIIYTLYLNLKQKKSNNDIENGKVYTHEQIKEMFN